MPENTQQQRALSGAPPRVRLFLLQQPGLQVGDQNHTTLAPKDAAMLAILAIEGSMARNRMASWLWPNTRMPQARANLRQRLLRLRRQFGFNLVTGHHLLTLHTCVVSELDEVIAALHQNPYALTGELLGTLDFPRCEELESWIRQAREHWRARCHGALNELARDHEQAGRFGHALPFAKRLAAEEPLHEHNLQSLMRLHHALGDRSAAIAAYEKTKTMLHRELGISPSTETQLLLSSIRNSASPGTPHQPAPSAPVAPSHPPTKSLE
jgi:DNA-binding SARP family transcriptional activator